MISPKDSKALLGGRPIICQRVLVETDSRYERERETSFANIFSPQIEIAGPLTSFCDKLFPQSTYTAHFFYETDGVFAAPLTFPLVGIQFRHRLRVCREVSLTVSDKQR